MKLGVNIDHVATLREIRKGIEPEPILAGLLAQNAGADSIVVHLREDRRHIKERDLFLLKELIKIKLNLEMSINPEILRIACKVRPDQATLVPERRQEITTEGGLDLVRNFRKVKEAVDILKKNKIAVSLFIDPEKSQIISAKKLGVSIIELHTGKYAEAKSFLQQDKYYEELVKAVNFAKSLGLTVCAGHGLNYFNAKRISRISGVEELNIGYAIVCRALIVGFENAVREMKRLINE
ncbi:MAG: pyridoxine 5'-phosphate synthase [Candidatus Omnitrophica bacterium]|nr:pyridoxine 5'-phosphate synthase [Candidatus Omnitrophota bacterium]